MRISSTAESMIQSGGYHSLSSKKTSLKKTVVCATLTACLGTISFGFVLGYNSPVETKLKDTLGWSNVQFSWFSSIPTLGAMLGAMIGLYTIDKYGRKFNIMMCSVPLVSGWILIVAVKRTSLLFLGRFVSGVGMGAISLSVPLYIAEISPAEHRGTLGSANQLGVTVGILLAYSFGAFLPWRWLAIAGAVPSVLMVILMSFFPETPRWLIKHGRASEARQVMMLLRGTSYEGCDEECREIELALEAEEPMSLKEFRRPTIYRPFIISNTLMLVQQFSGINAVLSYASEMLEKAGISNANVSAITIAVVQVVVTAVSCLIVDKLGRRLLLMFPTALMCISMIILGASRYFSHFPSIVTLISLCLYIVGFSFGLGPIPWLAMSELFPQKVRGVASGIVTQVNWLSAFTVIKTYDQMKHSFHDYGCFWFYAAVCLFGVIYVAIFLPETKGKTLEEVEELFAYHHDLQAPNEVRNNRTYNSISNTKKGLE